MNKLWDFLIRQPVNGREAHRMHGIKYLCPIVVQSVGRPIEDVKPPLLVEYAGGTWTGLVSLTLKEHVANH